MHIERAIIIVMMGFDTPRAIVIYKLTWLAYQIALAQCSRYRIARSYLLRRSACIRIIARSTFSIIGTHTLKVAFTRLSLALRRR
jgi:hypothetical protein